MRAAALLAVVLVPCAGNALAQPASSVRKLRIVGGLAGINQYVQHEEPFWERMLKAPGVRFSMDDFGTGQ